MRNPEDVWEGSRAALGLAVGNYYGHLFVTDVIVNMTAELKENIEWLQEMGCWCFSNVKENESQNLKYLTNNQMAARLREMDLVIPFGNPSFVNPPGVWKTVNMEPFDDRHNWREM